MNDLESAIEIGNGVSYGLSSAIYTRDVNRAFTAMRDMYTGIFYVNAWQRGINERFHRVRPTRTGAGYKH